MTPTNDWIADRRPTEADGDKDGEVLLKRFANGRKDSMMGKHDALVDWRHIGKGVPWKHTSIWQPSAAAEPAPTKPALAVGQRWRRRDGEVVRIFMLGNFFCDGECSYDLDGTAQFPDGPDSRLELVELLTPATPTPRRFKETPRRTVMSATIHTIDAIDEDGVAWWMITSPGGPKPEWYQLPPLPAKEAAQ